MTYSKTVCSGRRESRIPAVARGTNTVDFAFQARRQQMCTRYDLTKKIDVIAMTELGYTTLSRFARLTENVT